MTQESWQPISVDQLRVGHFVRLAHRWFEHPFVLNRFQIASDSEIAIIRDARLTKLFIDPARSTPIVQPAPADVPVPEVPTLFPQAEISQAAVQLQTLKIAQTQRVRDQHDQLARTRDHYSSAVDDCGKALTLLASGSTAAFAAAGGLSRSLLTLAAARENPLTCAAIAQPEDGAKRRAFLALDAAAIAAAVGRRLGLRSHGMTTLTMSAMLHSVGIEQLPSALQDESTLTDPRSLRDFQHYPSLGAEQLRRCGEFPLEVMQIVRQHRERMDGSGFPARASGDVIHPYARIIGAIREFQVLSMRDTSTLPATALAHLYRKLRGAYGPAAIDNVIAALTVYPPGSFLALSDGSIGRVVHVSDGARLRPTVCLFDDSVTPSEAQIVDLADTADVSVVRVLDPDKMDTDVRAFFGGDWAGLAFSTRAAQAA